MTSGLSNTMFNKSLISLFSTVSAAANQSIRSSAWIFQILLLAAAYFATGKLGIFLAVPPGYATAIWPPSGIALAGILLYGYRVWPGVLLGSILVNLPTTLVTGSTLDIAVSVGVILTISGGAALQAVTGAYLLKRFAGFPNLLAGEQEIFSFMLIGGILSSLVNCTISVTTLVLGNRIPIANFLTNWGTWWVGDAIGVFIFTPLILVWALRPSEAWVNRRKSISLAISITFLLTLALVSYASQKEKEHLEFEFFRDAAAFKADLEKSILTYFDVLRSLESFYSATAKVERQEFGVFVATSLANGNLQGIQALEWSPIIASPKRESFEKDLQNKGFPNFRITERDIHNHIIAADQRPEFAPVTFVEPYEGNESALGYDLYSNPIRRDAMDRARDTGEIAVTARIILVQEHGDQFGVLAFMPIYQKGLPHNTLEQRRLHITGFVLLVFRGRDIVTASLKNLNTDKLSYRLIDETAPPSEQLLFASGQQELIPFIQQEKGLFGKSLALISSSRIPIGGRLWRFEITPTQNYFADQRAYTAWLILLAGLLLSSLLGAFVLVSSGRDGLLRRQVAERTSALEQSEARFRAMANSALNESKKNATLLSTASDGIHILDAQGNVVQFNDAFARLLGYSHEETSRLNVADWDAQIPQDRLVDTIKSLIKQAAKFETKHRRKDGSIIDVEINANGVELEGKDFLYASARDITERKALERNLAASIKEIQDLYDHAPCGYHSLGPDGTYLRINDIELEWLGCRRDEVVGKMKATDFFTPEGVALFQLSFPKFLRDGHIEDLEFDLVGKAGAIRRISLCATALRDDNGHFLMSRSVVYDITELKNTQEKLNRLTVEQHAMLDNELVGIAKIKDRRIIWKNKALERIFGYGLDELDGKSLRVLYPDDTSYQAHGEAAYPILNAHGVYRTQIKMLRKDGETLWIDSHGVLLAEESDTFLWIMVDITAQKKHEEQITQIAYHDILTGLPNRLLVRDRLNQALALAERNKQLLAVCYLDLDGFKPVNDKFGHEAGDQLLIEVARRVQNSVRANDTVGRLGGDEFVLLLTNLENTEEYPLVLQRVIDTINTPIALDESNQAIVSASIGVTFFPADGNDADTLLRHADQAMYQAKKTGRNRICQYEI